MTEYIDSALSDLFFTNPSYSPLPTLSGVAFMLQLEVTVDGAVMPHAEVRMTWVDANCCNDLQVIFDDHKNSSGTQSGQVVKAEMDQHKRTCETFYIQSFSLT